MVTTVLLVRHADVHNPKNILYGRLPGFGLSKRGLKEAALLARALAEEPIAAIYSSPLLRARQTADIIARYHPGVPLHISKLLNEVRTSLQGRPSEEIRSLGFDYYTRRPSPRDETLEQVFARMDRLIRHLRRKHKGQTVLCVSHGDPICVVRLAYQGKPLDLQHLRGPDYPGKGSVTRLDFPSEAEADPVISYFDLGRLFREAEIEVPQEA
jgi:broad specificity phosphatase PhoE